MNILTKTIERKQSFVNILPRRLSRLNMEKKNLFFFYWIKTLLKKQRKRVIHGRGQGSALNVYAYVYSHL
jgi:hypothetical protein